MAILYGVQPVGFIGKPLAVLEQEIDDALKGILGASAGTEPDRTIPLRSKAGQIKSLLVDLFSEQWDLQQAVYSSFDPAAATNEALDAVASITGTIRRDASFSTVVGTCTGTPLTVLAIGRVATVEGTGTRFDTVSSATITAVPAWTPSTVYVAGDRVTNGGNVYQCTIGGTSDVSGGPSGTGSAIVDNTVTWRWLGAGTGAVDIVFVAEQSGALQALAGDLNQIATPVAGWANVINLEDAAVGAARETDPQLRARRDFEVTLSGNATADAIRAALLAMNQTSTDPLHRPATSVTVLHNDGDLPDVNGVPGHTVECIVEAPDIPETNQDIVNTIFASIAAGIGTYGGESGTAMDSQGNPQTVRWTRPDPVDIWIDTTVYYDPAKWPATGASALVVQGSLSALLTFGLGYPPGFNVRAAALSASLFDGPSAVDSTGTAIVPAPVGSPPMPGILDASPFYIGTAPSPVTSIPIVIGVREVAKFDSSRIAIATVAEAP